MRKGFAVWACALALVGVSGRAAEAPGKLLNISGVYRDIGTTMQASENAPKGDVSLTLLLARVINPDQYRAAAAKGGVVKIAQNGDSLLEIQTGPEAPATWSRGSYVDSWTKADGLKVEELQLTVSRPPPKKRTDGEERKIDGTYSFFLDTEKRLVVMVDFIVTKRGARPPSTYEKGIYIFPRIESAAAK
jgi:hypothetical protein